ncbi:TerC family protein [Sphingomonas aerophila]|uniref:Putative tellurium resistance membrane protein TerC n=1 Tax=Sphingomonas aerophila TaxID=1344948 RepID=A0A7W9BA10_9SPHN|nr:TerC family protein [Sphingomonas aerophila]MBB5713352.1 putative tellurium resistance membrane protein TerC [Sphingomonas aerophila]
MDAALLLLSSPAAWAALVTLIVMEVVLGIDNLIFISLLTNKLPEAGRAKIRRLGIALALVLRLVLLSTISWLTGLTAPVVDLGLSATNSRGELLYETAFSWRDLILLAVMFVAVIVAVVAMMVAAEPLANFINRNPSVVMLALAFLLMIGLVLMADACGVHVPKGYIYAAMAFSALVEALNLTSRRRKLRAAPNDARH